MQVTAKVTLRGGHVWEFVCDDGDPILTGLVSALPGASIDASLPPDGLLQVESRTGERVFVSRQSLVSITVSELGPTGAPFGTPRRGAITPVPFVILPHCLDEKAVADLSAAAGEMRSPAAADLEQVQLNSLPPTVSASLAAAVAEARTLLAPTEKAHSNLLLKIYLIDVDAQTPPIESTKQDLISFALILDGGKNSRVSAIVALNDLFLNGREDNSIADSRIVALAPNSLLAFKLPAQRVPIVLQRAENSGCVLFVSGSLKAKP
jgi:hypothetical protein